MVCLPCRNNRHDACIDRERLAMVESGLVPGVTASASSHCDCQHEPRKTEPEQQ